MPGNDAEPRTIRVVLVDDTESLRHLLRAVLELEPDFEVVGEAADGRQGMAVAAETQPDLIVSDVRMPVMNGAEAVSGYRAAAPGAVIVLMSGLGHAAAEPAWRQAGADLYINKNTDPDVVVARLRDVVRRTR